jgi:hypothetical protein
MGHIMHIIDARTEIALGVGTWDVFLEEKTLIF